MNIQFAWLNCFLLILPLLVWNIYLGPKITDQRIISDTHSPKWLLIAENGTRLLVFAFPLLLPLQLKDVWSKAGLGVYFIGTLVYFASWLPLMFAPNSAWSNSIAGLLAPRLTPYLSFLGIAFIGSSWLYGLLAAVFILFHSLHGIQNL